LSFHDRTIWFEADCVLSSVLVVEKVVYCSVVGKTTHEHKRKNSEESAQ